METRTLEPDLPSLLEPAGRRRRHFSTSPMLAGKEMGKRSRESTDLVSASEQAAHHCQKTRNWSMRL